MKTARKAVLVVVAVGICAAAIVVASGINHRNEEAKNKPPTQTESKATTSTAALVCIQTLQPTTMIDYLLLPGSVDAWEDIDLGAKAGGTVEEVPVEEGDRVASGTVIVRLDTASLVARRNQAQAQLDQAQKRFERTRNLVQKGVEQPAMLDDVTAQRDVAQATVDVAQVELDNATLRAPVPGVVDRIHVDQGEYVHIGDPVAKIVQIDRVKIVVNVPEKDIEHFRVGQKVGVFRDKIELAQMLPGTIAFVALTAHPLSRTYPLHVEVANADHRFRPGMIVRVGLIRRQVADTLAVPLFAVVDRGDRKVVFVEEDGRAVERPIEIGIIERNRVQVASGLNAGDRLICVGHRDLANGERVKVVERPADEQEAQEQ